jgi:hypothetical protein
MNFYIFLPIIEFIRIGGIGSKHLGQISVNFHELIQICVKKVLNEKKKNKIKVQTQHFCIKIGIQTLKKNIDNNNNEYLFKIIIN